eukprot:m51a1_g5645 hypothetical protein (156) ;mRNA; r:857524-859040
MQQPKVVHEQQLTGLRANFEDRRRELEQWCKATHVAVYPVTIAKNPTCADAAQILSLTLTYGIKINGEDVATPGVHVFNLTADGDQITIVTDGDGRVLQWSSTLLIDVIIMKGGKDGAIAWVYHPNDTNSSEDVITTPINPSGEPANISHINICW